MVDMAGKVFVDHDNTPGNILHLVKIVPLNAHDLVLKGGIRRHLGEADGRVVRATLSKVDSPITRVAGIGAV